MQNTSGLIKKIAAQFKESGFYLATAESCTGGLLGDLITNLSGASDFYIGGKITYSNTAKKDWLGVPQKTLDTFGAVSEETVLAMASGIRSAFSNSYDIDKIIGISISGIAGPGGGSAEKPVGTVWIGFSMHNKEFACQFHFSGDRQSIKHQSAMEALQILFDTTAA